MPYFKDIESDEIFEKRKKDSDIQYARVTEVTNCHPKKGCERMGWSAKNSKKVLYQTYTVAGTVVHWKIQKYLAEEYELVPPVELHKSLRKGELKLYQAAIAEEDVIIDGRTVNRQRMIPKIIHSYNNFLDFIKDPSSVWNRYKMVPLYLEKKVFSEKHQVGGTIDCIAIATIEGKQYIVIVDWKSGKANLPNYHWQLSAYGMLLKEAVENKKVILPEGIPISNKAWCIKFGGKTYDETMVNIAEESNLTEFFRGYKVYQTVTDAPKGWNILCMFCSFCYDCPR